LLHGFCETNQIWDRLRVALSDEFNVVAPDLPGFGQSPLPQAPFQLSDIAGRLHSWLQNLELSNYIVIGHSLGGYVTLEMVRSFSKNMNGFGLFNSSVFEDSQDKKTNRDKLIDFIAREGVKPFIKTFVPSLFNPERIQEFQNVIDEIRAIGETTSPETVMAYASAMRDRYDSFDLLKNNSDKALLIAGEKDQNVPIESSLKMAKVMPENQVYILPDTAHMGMFEQEELSAEIIRTFARQCFD
jgi:pimeloyl-ACP methyl ester carboxylesterase